MKNLRKIYKKYMIRPIIYKAFPRIIIGMLVAGLWNRFVNANQWRDMLGDAFMLVGIFFVALAWFSFLRLDGMDNPFTKLLSVFVNPKKKKTRMASRTTRHMVDYADEELTEYEDLSDEEQAACKWQKWPGSAVLYCAVAADLFLLNCNPS